LLYKCLIYICYIERNGLKIFSLIFSFPNWHAKKWLNLVRTYKNTKDVKRSRTERGPVKFTFHDRLDELLGDSPANASIH